MNQINLIGRIAKVYPVKKAGEGQVMNMILAVDKTYAAREDDEERAYFFFCQIWNKQAKTMAEWGSVGRRIYVTGEMRLNTGSKTFSLEFDGQDIEFDCESYPYPAVYVRAFEFLDNKPKSKGSSSKSSKKKATIKKRGASSSAATQATVKEGSSPPISPLPSANEADLADIPF